ncbi:cupredoxin domain-containing protein [Rhodovulum sp. PH10]|uniref:cupredoxin domain-containing protein n=1 Tax=Rhodovulum sp. PH10 TaxID=1187851 RepID=UPI00192ADA55|nr:cupredoxin domain-containing protein [Rhodovulum sp. PH10]
MLAAALTMAMATALPAGARADDTPVFRIEFDNGKVTPQRLEVPADTRIKLELHNAGTEPAEFESNELRKETVLAPGVTRSLIIRRLDPGQYDFFDDFHLDSPPAVLIAK